MSLYRTHIAFLLCAVISLNMLAVPISYLNFRIHQDYYAAVLCENPDKPITVCGGVCYLKKQLPESADGTPATFISKLDISVFYQSLTPWNTSPSQTLSSVFAPYRAFLTSTYLPPLDHPPQGL